ncbi:lysophospholipid acyltransferase family protein [Streptomyces tagetis]|uniref:1-acyl-sn-glycerol-3-phosphate acyltransferase n=1 Tax=Streptomyces tagetis TaxID=2820809 RepID=A0A940XK22_9ACTN|nr:lysophospholipid acyltransferase family protein [Streptomyces sp. RG38]MBQ0826070.1 1-acyl-sn-glycerol-3-phosphate acyltransferase [Streptomyces sp. RG38]
MDTWSPTAPCTPAACVRRGAGPAALPRALARLVAVTAVLAAGAALAPLRRLVPDAWVRRWCRALVRAAGVRVRISGAAAPAGGLLLVADHVSWLDIPLLAAVRPARMVAKSEIRRWPVAGALAARAGTLFIERDRPRALPGTVARIAGVLRAGAAVAVFPEGSTWCGLARGRYRRAVFQSALDAGVPVQPVRVRYRTGAGATATAAAFVGEDTLLASVWRVVSARHLSAEVDVLPALPPGRHRDRRSLCAAARSGHAGVPAATLGHHGAAESQNMCLL